MHPVQCPGDYFANLADTIEFDPFEKALEYYGSGDRVVIIGNETFKAKNTGVTHRAGWAWVIDMQEGLITGINHIEDLSGIAGPVRGTSSSHSAQLTRDTLRLGLRLARAENATWLCPVL